MQRRWLAFQPRVMTALARDFAKVLNRCGDKYLAGRKWVWCPEGWHWHLL